jgi:hypothetical protein
VAALLALYYFFGRRYLSRLGRADQAERERLDRPLLDPEQFRAERDLLIPIVSEISKAEDKPGGRPKLKNGLPKGLVLKSAILEQICDDVYFCYSEEQEFWVVNPYAVCEIFKYDLSESDLAIVYREVSGTDLRTYDYEERVKELVDQLPSRK